MADAAVAGQQPATSRDGRVRRRLDAGHRHRAPQPTTTRVPMSTRPVPGTPVATAVAGYRSVALTWTLPLSGGSALTNFIVYRGTSPTSMTNGRRYRPLTPRGPTPAHRWTTYYYRSRRQLDGESLRSPTVTPSQRARRSCPPTPVVSATTAPNQVALSWSPPSANGSPLTGYTVYRGTSHIPITVRHHPGRRGDGVCRLRPDERRQLLTTGFVQKRRRSLRLLGRPRRHADVHHDGGGRDPFPHIRGTSASLTLPAETAPGDLLIAWLGFSNATSAYRRSWTDGPRFPGRR